MIIFMYRTLDERANRLFATKGKKMTELGDELLPTKATATGKDQAVKEHKREHDLALIETRIYRLALLLNVGLSCMNNHTF